MGLMPATPSIFGRLRAMALARCWCTFMAADG
jgi:hypothetical protein